VQNNNWVSQVFSNAAVARPSFDVMKMRITPSLIATIEIAGVNPYVFVSGAGRSPQARVATTNARTRQNQR
jgi:hypothetical protein